MLPDIQTEPTAEDLHFTPPSFSRDVLGRLLFREYAISGELKLLAGERDQNLRVTTRDDRRFVLKVSSRQESADAVDLQIQALERIRRRDPALPVPRHVRTTDGALQTAVANDDGITHHVRLLTYLPGEPLQNLGPPSERTMRAVGALMGRMCQALHGFSHPAADRFMAWDTMNGLTVLEAFRSRYLPHDLKETCAPFFERFASHSLPRLRQLPSQLIHNDMHLGNLLCDPAKPTELTGCIDFGDMVDRPTVLDLAATLGEIIGIATDPLARCRALLDGFRRHVSFPDDQVDLLYDAIQARTVLCAQLAMFRIAWANNDPDIESVHLPHAIDAVRAISSIDRDSFVRAIASA